MTEPEIHGQSGTRRGAGRRLPVISEFRWRVTLGLALVVVAVVVALVILERDGAEEAMDEAKAKTEGRRENNALPISEFAGSGDSTTNRFKVESGWEIRWESLGDSFEVTLYTSGGASRGKIIDRTGQGSGSSYPPAGGEYYLEVMAEGDWTIRVFRAASAD